MKQPMRKALAVPTGEVVLAGFDSGLAPGVPAGRRGKPRNLVTAAAELAGLQERLYAEATAGGVRRILLVLQGMDTSGKGGVTNHVVATFEPVGLQYTAFKAPTADELSHDFLWRIRKRLPDPGIIGVFDRSHYEDVLVPRVHQLISSDELNRRYDTINQFEAELTESGATIVKCFLHISFDTQRQRLLARLDRADKRWKFNEADLVERARWSDYTAAYEAILERCNTDAAPWFVVPSDSKRYRNWAIGELLRETLHGLDPQYPDVHADIDALRARLAPPN